MLYGEAFTIKSEHLGNLKVRRRLCPMCGCDNHATKGNHYSFDIWQIVDCTSCSFTYIDKAPAYEELNQNISWEKTFEIEVERRTKMRPISYKLSRMTRWRLSIFPRNKFPDLVRRYSPRGRVLDVGCGNGEQLRGLEDQFQPCGIEISAALAEQAKEFFNQYGGDCVCAPALDGLASLPDNHLSAITMRSYLEHESQPLEVLKEAYRTLTKGGVVIIKVPNYASLNRFVMGKDWCGFRYPDHQNYFTPKTLRQMSRRAGFSKFHTHWRFEIPISDNFYLVAEK